MLVLSTTLFSQTTINGDFTVTSGDHQIGQNCGGGGNQLEQYTITGNLILNTNIPLDLKGVNLTVNGSIIGPGSYRSTCNNNLSQLNGVIVPLDGTLSNDSFEFNNSIVGLEYKVYSINGQLIKSGIVDRNLLSDLPKSKLMIIKVGDFKPKKLIIN